MKLEDELSAQVRNYANDSVWIIQSRELMRNAAEEIKELRAELAALQHQEPVATVRCINGVTIGYLDQMLPVGTKLYLAAGAKEKTE